VIWFPRIVGILTAVYGASAIARPDVIGRHGGYADWRDPQSGVRLLSTVVGVRDLVSGIAIVAAPAGDALYAALGARVAFDASDAAAFGLMLPSTRGRRMVALVAGGWAALAAASALFAGGG
jgi:hypothetical protein